MKVGDYVRTKDGKIFKWNILCKIKQEWSGEYINEYTRFCYIDKNDIIKSSPNIIDLLEVGDYVNGFEVLRIDKECNLYPKTLKCQYPNNVDYFDIFNEDIKSIVTKETFESMEYKIDDKKVVGETR